MRYSSLCEIINTDYSAGEKDEMRQVVKAEIERGKYLTIEYIERLKDDDGTVRESSVTITHTFNRVSIRRVGETENEMIIVTGKTEKCEYNTPFGSLDCGIRGNKVSFSTDDGKCRLSFDYEIDFDGFRTHHETRITFKDIEK